MINPMALTGKRIMITGASSGIGRACAKTASQLGASVVLTARRGEELEKTISLMDDSDQHKFFVCSVDQSDDIARLMDFSVEGGKLDGLIHAAGVGPAQPIGFMQEEVMRSAFDTNYYSFMTLMKFCSKNKYRNKQFSAVAVSSVSALAGWQGVSMYAGTKGALCSSARALAIELATKGIRVNTLCPSNVQTPMLDAILESMDPESGRAAIESRQPLGIGTPEQVAMAACFLLSDAASFITGVNLPVDGGYLAQ